MNIPSHILEATRKRFEERNEVRASNIDNINAGDIKSANDPGRFELRKERLADAGGAISIMTLPNDGGAAAIITNSMVRPTFDLAMERIIGKSDFVGVVYLELGLRAARTVGRIQVGARNGGTHSFGTGFLVAPRLLLTNNHVLASKEHAQVSTVEFNYQHGIDGRLALPVTFDLDPDAFFVTDATLDYALVALRDRSEDGTMKLGDYGWNKLIEQVGKVVTGEAVNIIQHPEAQPKKVALRENQITDILDNFLHYRTDTSPGSSGAPVYNDQWELVALHHSGVPAMDADGNILARKGGTWTPAMGEDQVKWVGNEGVRISRIIQHVRSQELGEGMMELFEEAFTAPPAGTGTPNEGSAQPAPVVTTKKTDVTPQIDQAPATANITIDAGDGTTWTIPLQINVQIGQPVAAGTDGDTSELETASSYSNRKGYSADFLGSGKFRVPLPQLSPAIAGDVATLIGRPTSTELKYINYSVVMNKARRMAFFTAVNIDGEKAVKLNRGEDDKWIFDPRILEKYQIGENAYNKNNLDRGHLVRRLDPVWGTMSVAEKADADTFHFTNCTPQHKDFNQKTWLSLEDYVLRNADKNDLKVSVFTGPVFRDDDKTYRSIRLPQQFWKVAVMMHDGNLSATGYMLSQQELLNRLEAAFVYGEFKTYQVPIHLIEELTGLDFGALRNFDPLREQVNPDESLLESDILGSTAIEIGGEEDLRF